MVQRNTFRRIVEHTRRAALVCCQCTIHPAAVPLSIAGLSARSAIVNVGPPLVGPRFTFRRKRVSPLVYGLFGVTRFSASATVSGQRFSDVDTGFSSAVGGGMDITLNDRVAIRAFQLDYFRPNFFGEAHNRGRLAFGVVFHLGKN